MDSNLSVLFWGKSNYWVAQATVSSIICHYLCLRLYWRSGVKWRFGKIPKNVWSDNEQSLGTLIHYGHSPSIETNDFRSPLIRQCVKLFMQHQQGVVPRQNARKALMFSRLGFDKSLELKSKDEHHSSQKIFSHLGLGWRWGHFQNTRDQTLQRAGLRSVACPVQNRELTEFLCCVCSSDCNAR